MQLPLHLLPGPGAEGRGRRGLQAGAGRGEARRLHARLPLRLHPPQLLLQLPRAGGGRLQPAALYIPLQLEQLDERLLRAPRALRQERLLLRLLLLLLLLRWQWLRLGIIQGRCRGGQNLQPTGVPTGATQLRGAAAPLAPGAGCGAGPPAGRAGAAALRLRLLPAPLCAAARAAGGAARAAGAGLQLQQGGLL